MKSRLNEICHHFGLHQDNALAIAKAFFMSDWPKGICLKL